MSDRSQDLGQYPSSPMPVVFVGHGNLMNALNRESLLARSWRKVAESMQRPRAILAISAHWYIHGTKVTARALPRRRGLSYPVEGFGGGSISMLSMQIGKRLRVAEGHFDTDAAHIPKVLACTAALCVD